MWFVHHRRCADEPAVAHQPLPLLQVKATFSSKIYGMNMVILVPVPESTAKANILVTVGKAKYDATKKALVRLKMVYIRGLILPLVYMASPIYINPLPKSMLPAWLHADFVFRSGRSRSSRARQSTR